MRTIEYADAARERPEIEVVRAEARLFKASGLRTATGAYVRSLYLRSLERSKGAGVPNVPIANAINRARLRLARP